MTKTTTPPLITLDQIDRLSLAEVEKIYRENINPGQAHYFRILGFGRVLVRRAEGAYYHATDGSKILDLAGGAGCVVLGHNHPRVVKARQRFQEDGRHDIGQWFYSQYVAALSKNLVALAPGDLEGVLLYNTGSEAVEAALKVVEKHHGPGRARLVYTRHSFHGRTRASLSLSDAEGLRGSFRLFDDHVKVPFGDAEAIDAALAANPGAGAVILEPIQGGAGVVIPPDGYLRRVREICDRRKALLIFDEIQCGLGRTGTMFACDREGVVPDILLVAKPLSGAKTAISAMLVRRPIFDEVTANPKEWHINVASTFGGMGEACVTALETLNVIVEEGLIPHVEKTGEYFLEQLRALKDEHPRMIKDVRGRGFMLAVEFHDMSQAAPKLLGPLLSTLDDRLKGSLAGLASAVLLGRHKVIVGLTGTNPNVIRLYPPFVAQREDIDLCIRALRETVKGGLTGLVAEYAKLQF